MRPGREPQPGCLVALATLTATGALAVMWQAAAMVGRALA